MTNYLGSLYQEEYSKLAIKITQTKKNIKKFILAEDDKINNVLKINYSQLNSVTYSR